METVSAKALIRKSLLAARKNSLPAFRLCASKLILDQVVMLRCWKAAKHIGCYISLADEVCTHDLINTALASGKEIAAPVIHSREHKLSFCPIQSLTALFPGPLNILEPPLQNPVAASWFDLMIVPGVGFDLHGHRIGYGQGFYDHYLVQVTAVKLALAFDFQIVDHLPSGPDDVSMDIILTEKRSLLFNA